MEQLITLQAGECDAGRRLDQVIAAKCMDLSRSYIQKLIKEENCVSVNGNFGIKTKYPVSFGDEICIRLPAPDRWKSSPRTSRWIFCMRTTIFWS